jgi:4-hydroxybutyryl-CoA dehydratase / vinylacetyl-CoA-Delta-isomerase
MPLMTPEQYEKSLRTPKLEVYMFGKRVSNPVDDPIIRTSMKAVAKTYELDQRPEYEEIMTARSHLNGQQINRYAHNCIEARRQGLRRVFRSAQ